MLEKSIGIYHEHELNASITVDRVLLFIQSTQLIVLQKNFNQSKINGFEVFSFSDQISWPAIIESLKKSSALCNNNLPVQVVFEHASAVLLPTELIQENTINAAINLVHCVQKELITLHNSLAFNQQNITIGYRVNIQLFQSLQQHFNIIQLQHVYQNVLQQALNLQPLQETAMYILMYQNLFVLACIKNKHLQLIQTFTYQTPEDVLYKLLQITQQYQLEQSNCNIILIGVIDLEQKLYQLIKDNFMQVSVPTLVTNNILEQSNVNYPSHYFTFYFNSSL